MAEQLKDRPISEYDLAVSDFYKLITDGRPGQEQAADMKAVFDKHEGTLGSKERVYSAFGKACLKKMEIEENEGQEHKSK